MKTLNYSRKMTTAILAIALAAAVAGPLAASGRVDPGPLTRPEAYARAALTKALRVKVVSPRFLETKGNEAKIVSFFAKKARGLMARYMIDHRIDDVAGLKDFNTAGYVYRPDLSAGDDWVFTRPQPELVSATRARALEDA